MTAVAEPVRIHFKLIPVPRLGEPQRSEELRRLAEDTEISDFAAEVAVRALAHFSLLKGDGAKAWEAFCEYRNALLTADGIESGAVDWREYAPYTCGDRKEQAWLDACGEVDGWLRVLLGGHGAARHIHTTERAGA